MTLPETAASRWEDTEGLPFPLGSTKMKKEGVYNFALYSKHAESVTLLLYTDSEIVNPVLVYQFDYLKNKTGRVWHCRIPFASMRSTTYYAYKVLHQANIEVVLDLHCMYVSVHTTFCVRRKIIKMTEIE